MKHLPSFLLPLTALVIIPFGIESNFAVTVDGESIIGAFLVLAGLIVLAATASLFIRFGEGTIAPWSPTRRLVVKGPYRYVRNPMITGVLSVLLGETLAFHSVPILIWLVSFFVINNIYFFFLEEPGLVKRFGDDYVQYARNVPRWIPRMKPWNIDNKDAMG